MVFVDPVAIGHAPYLASWMERLPPLMTADMRTALSVRWSACTSARSRCSWCDCACVCMRVQSLFATCFDPALRFKQTELKEPVATVTNNVLASLCNLLDCFLEWLREKEGRENAKPVSGVRRPLPSGHVLPGPPTSSAPAPCAWYCARGSLTC
jgi:hypothetical protein